MAEEEMEMEPLEEEEENPWEDVIEGDIPSLDPNDPLLRPVQAAMYKVLEENNQKISLELRGKAEELKRAKAAREETGVDLYSVQQQLAKLQMALERSHEQFNIMMQMRERSEEDNGKLSDVYQSRKLEVQEMRVKLSKYQAELDKVNLTLRQVERYNDQMRGEISVTRRATYKAEEDLSGLEKRKKWQDLYIDAQHDKIKQLEEQLALFDAQLESQKAETKAAHDTLHEAAEEMQAINYEKRTLLQQWKSSLIALQRRDEALQQTENELRNQRERLLTQETEIGGFKRAIETEQYTNEKLTATLGKLQAEIVFIEKQLEEVKEKRARLNEKYTMLKKSLDQTDVELQDVAKDVEAVEAESKEIDKEWVKVHTEKTTVELSIEQYLSEQTTASRYAAGEQKDARKLIEEVREKEVNLSGLQNELSRIRVDALNTLAHNNALKDTRNTILTDLEEKEKLIDDIEVEIARKHTQIERKQVDIDKLNKRYEALTSGTEEENMGPLEATIHNTTKEIQKKVDECTEYKRQWMKHQTELVAVNSEASEQSDVNNTIKSELAVLYQQQLRLDSNIAGQDKELVDLKRSIQNLRGEMQRINSLIAQANKQEETLDSLNRRTEEEFQNRLVALEGECINIEQAVDGVKSEKEQLLLDISESEKQIMLIERKIQLAKETIEALDPNVGRAENTKMKQEIHRMELRHVQLKKKQEQMIKEMEDAIYRKEQIKNKGKTRMMGKGAKAPAGNKQSMQGLSKKLEDSSANLEKYNESITAYQDSYNEKLLQDQQMGNNIAHLKDRMQEMQHGYEGKVEQKKAMLETIMRNQKAAKHFAKATRESVPLSIPEEALPEEVQKAHAQTDTIINTIRALQQQVPELADRLERVIPVDTVM